MSAGLINFSDLQNLKRTSLTGSGNWIVPANVNHVFILACGGGGGGGGGASTAIGSNIDVHGGEGGEGTQPQLCSLAVTPGASLAYSVGTGGTGGAGGTNVGPGSGPGSDGSNGSTTTFVNFSFAGGRGGVGGSAGVFPVSPNSPLTLTEYTPTAIRISGGNSDSGTGTSDAGTRSIYRSGGAGGTYITPGSNVRVRGGGGGGASISAGGAGGDGLINVSAGQDGANGANGSGGGGGGALYINTTIRLGGNGGDGGNGFLYIYYVTQDI